MLRSLTRTLATLPAYQAGAALADAPPAFTEVGVRYSHYSEDDIDASSVIFGATSRYDIDITQLWIEAPVGASWSVALDVQNDYQTGASPWFVGTDQNGQPGVIMSGASIQDNRVEVGVATGIFGQMAMPVSTSPTATKTTTKRCLWRLTPRGTPRATRERGPPQ